jgi:DNA-binding GntR family transcriptional regulator
MTFRTKEDFVAEFIREGIIAGRFPRGARLKQDEIAARLDISVTPVREAFRILEAEGYLVSARHRGVTVAPFDPDTAGELTELRVLLESRLVAAAVRAMGPPDIAQLRRLQHEVEAAVHAADRTRIRAANYRFHSHLYGLAKLPQTLRFVQMMWAKFPFDLIHRIEGRPARLLEEHDVLFDALAAGDSDAAVRAVRAHIEGGWRELEAELGARATARDRT